MKEVQGEIIWDLGLRKGFPQYSPTELNLEGGTQISRRHSAAAQRRGWDGEAHGAGLPGSPLPEAHSSLNLDLENAVREAGPSLPGFCSDMTSTASCSGLLIGIHNKPLTPFRNELGQKQTFLNWY